MYLSSGSGLLLISYIRLFSKLQAKIYATKPDLFLRYIGWKRPLTFWRLKKMEELMKDWMH